MWCQNSLDLNTWPRIGKLTSSFEGCCSFQYIFVIAMANLSKEKRKMKQRYLWIRLMVVVKLPMKCNFLLAYLKELSKWWRMAFILLWYHPWLPSYSRFWFMQIRWLVTSASTGLKFWLWFMSPDLYLPEMKTALFVAPEFTDVLVLVLCNVHIRLHQEGTTRANNSDFPLWMEVACSPLCSHRKFTVEISWNFVMSVTTVLSFTYIQKKSWEIFNFLWRHNSSDLHKSKSRITRQPRMLSQ